MNLDELHKKLFNHIEEQKKNWKSFIYAKEKGFYQGYEEIKIEGWRPTEKRFESYKISEFLGKEKTALDIGCNCGFFSLHVSNYVKSIKGVEINPYLIAIAQDTKDFLKKNNATFENSSFENFITNEKYEIIFSLANDSTIDKNTKFNFQEYIDKILSLLKNKGILIFENQAADMMPETKFDPKLEILKKYFKILDKKKVYSEYPVNVPERILLVLEKL